MKVKPGVWEPPEIIQGWRIAIFVEKREDPNFPIHVFLIVYKALGKEIVKMVSPLVGEAFLRDDLKTVRAYITALHRDFIEGRIRIASL